MGVLTRKVTLAGDRGEREVQALFDSGASFTFLRKDVAEKVATPLRMAKPRAFELAEEGRHLTVTEMTVLDVELNGFRLVTEVFVSEKLAEEFIVGARTMQSWRMKLDFEKDRIEIDPETQRLRLM